MTVDTSEQAKVDCTMDICIQDFDQPGGIVVNDTAVIATRLQLQNSIRTVGCPWRGIRAEDALATSMLEMEWEWCHIVEDRAIRTSFSGPG